MELKEISMPSKFTFDLVDLFADAKDGDAEAQCQLALLYLAAKDNEQLRHALLPFPDTHFGPDPASALLKLVAKSGGELGRFVKQCRKATAEEKPRGIKAVKQIWKAITRDYDTYEIDQVKFARSLQESATKGDAQAAFVLGYCSEIGLFTSESAQQCLVAGNMQQAQIEQDKQTYARYQSAAARRHVKAQCVMGIMHEEGLCGAAKDISKAIENYEFAAQQRNAKARFRVGLMYESGESTVLQALAKQFPEYKDKNNIDNAITCYSFATDIRRGVYYAPAAVKLADYYETGTTEGRLNKNPERVAAIYRLAADIGHDPIANLRLAQLYEHGAAEYDIERNDPEAARRYRLSAEFGNVTAQYNIGLRYLHNHGVLQDDREGISWLIIAANRGYPRALLVLGECYERGLHVDQDLKQANELYKEAAEMANIYKPGSSEAKVLLASCYEYGRGINKDEKEALTLYQSAAKSDNAEAETRLGVCYQEGQLGQKQNFGEAVKFYELAAKKGFALAQYHLGRCYEEGLGVGKDDKKAVELYTLAAEQWDPMGQCALGKCYEQGLDGLSKNRQLAAEYYKRAAYQDYVPAQREYARCCEKGIGLLRSDKAEAEKWFAAAAKQAPSGESTTAEQRKSGIAITTGKPENGDGETPNL